MTRARFNGHDETGRYNRVPQFARGFFPASTMATTATRRHPIDFANWPLPRHNWLDHSLKKARDGTSGRFVQKPSFSAGEIARANRPVALVVADSRKLREITITTKCTAYLTLLSLSTRDQFRVPAREFFCDASRRDRLTRRPLTESSSRTHIASERSRGILHKSSSSQIES